MRDGPHFMLDSKQSFSDNTVQGISYTAQYPAFLDSVRAICLEIVGKVVKLMCYVSVYAVGSNSGTLAQLSTSACCRFLPLDGMTLPEIREVENLYLDAAKWPWNKIRNGSMFTHPEWKNRLLSADTSCMLEHLSDYDQQARRKQGLIQLGAQSVINLEDQQLESSHAIDWDEEGTTDDEDTDANSESHTDFECDSDLEFATQLQIDADFDGADVGPTSSEM